MTLEKLCSLHKVDVQEETSVAGDSGGMIRSWATAKTKQKCRCRPANENEAQDYAKRGQRVNWIVYYATNPGLSNKNRLVFVDSDDVTHYLQVQTVHNPHQMDRFWKVACLEAGDVDNT